MKILLISLLLTTSVQASLFKKFDKKNDCDRYTVVSKVKNDQGDLVHSRELEVGETEFLDRTIAGMTLDNLTIDFVSKTVQAEVWLKRVFVRSPLFGSITEPAPVLMKSTNPQLGAFINSINSDLLLINQICVSKDNQVKYIDF